ncbi:MAG: hypothetical protein OXI13_06355 [Gammaproteobacteria bacterium]|nr:hypothetical protein [Gammaproteobacteria bacterium]
MSRLKHRLALAWLIVTGRAEVLADHDQVAAAYFRAITWAKIATEGDGRIPVEYVRREIEFMRALAAQVTHPPLKCDCNRYADFLQNHVNNAIHERNETVSESAGSRITA